MSASTLFTKFYQSTMLSFAGSTSCTTTCNPDYPADPCTYSGEYTHRCCLCGRSTQNSYDPAYFTWHKVVNEWFPESDDDTPPWLIPPGEPGFIFSATWWTINDEGEVGCRIYPNLYCCTELFKAQGDCGCHEFQVYEDEFPFGFYSYNQYSFLGSVDDGCLIFFYNVGPAPGPLTTCRKAFNSPSSARTALQHAMDSSEIRQQQQKKRAGGGGCSSEGCSAPAGPQAVNPAIGNLSIALSASGVVLTHHSRAGEPGGWAPNWRGSLERDIDEIDATQVDLITGNGSVYRYTDKDVDGNYTRPAGAKGTLVKTGGTWTETFPDGKQNHYDSTGLLATVGRKQSSDVVTFTYDDVDLDQLTHITNHRNQRTTFTYDGSGYIRRIQDMAGRITTYTIEGGDLTKQTSSEGCVTELKYDVNGRLTTHIDPDGLRTTYSYDGIGRATEVQPAVGG